MTKHTGQYTCEKCKLRCKTKELLNEHVKVCHNKPTLEEKLECPECKKTFATQHSLKQHTAIKHKGTRKPHIGHPEQAKEKNESGNQSLNIV